MAAVDLHGDLTHIKVTRNLFVQSAGDHMRHDLPLPQGQRGKALAQSFDYASILTPLSISLDAELNRVKQLLIAERLGEELDRTGLHRPHTHGDVAVASDEDDRKVAA